MCAFAGLDSMFVCVGCLVVVVLLCFLLHASCSMVRCMVICADCLGLGFFVRMLFRGALLIVFGLCLLTGCFG